jgi:hypothetical protein
MIPRRGNLKGHGFSRAENVLIKRRALASAALAKTQPQIPNQEISNRQLTIENRRLLPRKQALRKDPIAIPLRHRKCDDRHTHQDKSPPSPTIRHMHRRSSNRPVKLRISPINNVLPTIPSNHNFLALQNQVLHNNSPQTLKT